MNSSEANEKIEMIKELETLLYKMKKKSNNKPWEFQDFNKDVSGTDKFFTQADIIKSILMGKDTINVLPTGGGKTLCFQAPAIISDGLTIVISPLRSLYEEQVRKFNDNYCYHLVKDARLYKKYCNTGYGKMMRGALPMAVYPGLDEIGYADRLFDNIRKGITKKSIKGAKFNIRYKLLYLSPERLSQGKFFRSLVRAVEDGLRINALIIDEAHLMSQWSLDFRLSFLNIIDFLKAFEKSTGKRPLCGCFTATATSADIERIKTLLGFRRYKEFICRKPRNKINIQIMEAGIRYTKKGNAVSTGYEKKLKEILFGENRETFTKCIVFCNNRKKIESLEKSINKWAEQNNEEASCLFYHAKMPLYKRMENQDRFSRANGEKGAARIMLSTIAFGIGIDNSDVDLVIHLGMTSSPEEYLQEIGRIRRKSGKAILIYKKDGISVTGSVINVAKKTIKWDLDMPPASPINRMDVSFKDLLIMTRIYRFCRMKEILENYLNSSSPDKSDEMLEAITAYFEEDLSDRKNGSQIKKSIMTMLKEVGRQYETLNKDLMQKKISSDNKSDGMRKNNKRLKYIRERKTEQEKTVNKIDEVMSEFYSGAGSSYGDFYQTLEKYVSLPKYLKVNNTRIANKLRWERIELDHPYDFDETERKIKKIRVVEDTGILNNYNIFVNTAITTAPQSVKEAGNEEFVRYINERYGDLSDIEYIYIIHESEKKLGDENSYIVSNIFEKTDDGWIMLQKEDSSQLDNQKDVLDHLGCDVGNLRLLDGLLVSKIFKTLESNLDNPWEPEDPFYIIEGKREKRISFTISPALEHDDIQELKSCDTSDRIITYFDMMVMDCIYTLFFYSEKIYLQSIWELMRGDSDIKLPTGTAKQRIIDSIEKMNRLSIHIEDSSLIEPIDGFLLDVSKADESRGYVLNSEPVLFQYAEKTNGRILSLNVQNMKASRYFDDRSVHAAIENSEIIHYVLHRLEIVRRSGILKSFSIKTMLDILSSEISQVHHNEEYIKAMIERVLDINKAKNKLRIRKE